MRKSKTPLAYPGKIVDNDSVIKNVSNKKVVIPMDIIVSEDVEAGFLQDIGYILADSDFRKLSRYVQHKNTTRLMHSINVAYISWKLAKKMGCDARTAARIGMLHDFCLYDFRERANGSQVFRHPKVAAEKSEERFEISDKEKKAILSHMFPLGPLPTSKEAWIISFADKMCAVTERFSIDIALSRKNRIQVNAA